MQCCTSRSRLRQLLPELLTARIKSLRELGHADWLSLMEPLVVFDAILQQDPARAYARMDFDSREHYRKRIAEIARHSTCSESQVASAALELAQQAQQRKLEDPRLYLQSAYRLLHYRLWFSFPHGQHRVPPSPC